MSSERKAQALTVKNDLPTIQTIVENIDAAHVAEVELTVNANGSPLLDAGSAAEILATTGDDDETDGGEDSESDSDAICDICGEEFASYQGMRIHQGRRHKDAESDPGTQGEIECQICGDRFETEHGRKIHHGQMHTAAESYESAAESAADPEGDVPAVTQDDDAETDESDTWKGETVEIEEPAESEEPTGLDALFPERDTPDESGDEPGDEPSDELADPLEQYSVNNAEDLADVRISPGDSENEPNSAWKTLALLHRSGEARTRSDLTELVDGTTWEMPKGTISSALSRLKAENMIEKTDANNADGYLPTDRGEAFMVATVQERDRYPLKVADKITGVHPFEGREAVEV